VFSKPASGAWGEGKGSRIRPRRIEVVPEAVEEGGEKYRPAIFNAPSDEKVETICTFSIRTRSVWSQGRGIAARSLLTLRNQRRAATDIHRSSRCCAEKDRKKVKGRIYACNNSVAAARMEVGREKVGRL